MSKKYHTSEEIWDSQPNKLCVYGAGKIRNFRKVSLELFMAATQWRPISLFITSTHSVILHT